MNDPISIAIAGCSSLIADQIVKALQKTIFEVKHIEVIRKLSPGLAAHFDVTFTEVSCSSELLCSIVTATRKDILGMPLVAITNTVEDGRCAIRYGADDYLLKEHIHESVLEKAIRDVIGRKNLADTYRMFFEDNPAAMWAFDPSSLQVKMVNASALQMYGYTQDEFLSLAMYALWADDTINNWIRSHRTRKDAATVYRHRKKNGDELMVHVRVATRERDDINLSFVTIEDVTEKNRTLELLKSQEERLRMAAFVGRMLIMDVDYRTDKVMLTGNTVELFGSNADSIETLAQFLKCVHPDDRGVVAEGSDLFKMGSPFNLQFRIVSTEGTVTWLERRASLTYDEHRTVIGSRGLLVDITALKVAESHLLAAFTELEVAANEQASILNAVPAPIALLNDEGIIVAVNDAWKIFGQKNGAKSFTHYVGESYFARGVTGDETARDIYEGIRDVIAGRRSSYTTEYPCHAPHERRWFTLVASPLSNDSHRGAVVMHVDISARKLAEEQLSQAQANLTTLFNNTDDAFILIDQDFRIVSSNRQARNNILFGPRVEEAEGEVIFNHLRDEHVALFRRHLNASQYGQAVICDIEYTVGSEMQWFNFKFKAIRPAGGELTGFNISAHDYSERKLAELRLKESEERFRGLIENSGDMFVICDVAGRLRYISPSITRILGYRSDTLSESVDHFIHPEDMKAFTAVLTGVIKSGSTLGHFTVRLRDRNDQWVWVEGTMTNLLHITSVNGIVANFRDITSRMNMERDLKQSQYFLEKAMNVARLGYWTANATDASDLTWSKQTYSIYGCSPESFKPTLANVLALMPSDDQENIRQQMAAGQKDWQSFSLQHRCIWSDGSIRWIHLEADFIFDSEGRPNKLVGIAQDITENRHKEESLRQGKNNLDALINSTDDMVWAIDTKGILTAANTAYQTQIKNLFGYDAVVGSPVIVGKAPTGQIAEWELYYAQALTGKHLAAEVENLPGLEGRCFDLRLNPIVDNNKVIGVSGYARDITDKRNAEKVIREVNDRYEILSMATNDAVWDWDVPSATIRWNHGLEHIFGFTELTRENTFAWWQSRLHPDDKTEVLGSLDRAFTANLNLWSTSYRFKSGNGEYKYVFARGYIVYENKVPVRMIGSIQDIHELTEYRKLLEEKVSERTRELNAALAKEKELVDMKNRFVSIASHEFRTPLSTIEFAIGFLSAYRHKISDEEVARKLQTVERQVMHMTSLLDDVLTVGKTDSGAITVTRSVFRFEDFISDLVKAVRRASKSSHGIELSITAANAEVTTDEKLLQNILTNLLNNAIKFSPEKTNVALTCVQTPRMLFFKVTDNGIGIAQEDMKHIFEPFNRGSNVGTISGTGLGLTIVKKAVDLLNGEIEVSSRPGRTEFSVYIPL